MEEKIRREREGGGVDKNEGVGKLFKVKTY